VRGAARKGGPYRDPAGRPIRFARSGSPGPVRPVRFARFGAECVEAALAASGRALLVVDPGGVDDDLVRDITEILTVLCARLYGRRAAAGRAARAAAAVTAEDPS
jgi:hypothetical protein